MYTTALLSLLLEIFPENQLYVVYSSEDAGVPLEDYLVRNEYYKQVASYGLYYFTVIASVVPRLTDFF